MYRCFVRNWWRRGPTGKLEPNTPLPRGNTQARFERIEDARQWCENYNRTHPAGKLSRKAEFSSE